MNLHDYNLIIVNSSGGKDSICALWEVCKIAAEQNYPNSQIVVSHQELGEMEWPGTKELVAEQSEFFGLETYYSKRRDKNGVEGDLLSYVERRGMWPSSKMRFCTSDFKRAPGRRVVTALTKDMEKCKVLYVFGFRAEESPARKNKVAFELNADLTTQTREVYNWLPIHDWSQKKVWTIIKLCRLPYHKAYDLGMPRLSCVFCIFSPFDALAVAGKANPELLQRYVEVEQRIGHDFKHGMPIAKVQKAINDGYEPKTVTDWIM